jgi:hypothetical protein
MPSSELRLSKKNNCGSGFCGKIQSRLRESGVRSQASEAFGTGMSSSSRWGKPFGYRWCDARFRGLIRIIRCKPSSVSDLAFHEKAGRCQELLWLSKFISDVFLRSDISAFRLARRRSRPSAASSSGALTGAAASHSWVIRAKENTRMLLSRPVFTNFEPGLNCRPPFHPHSS